MNFAALRFFHFEKIKPAYHLAEGDRFILTARINRTEDNRARLYNPNIDKRLQEKNRESGLYFLRVAMKTLPQWIYVYKGYTELKPNNYEMVIEHHLMNDKKVKSGVINNQLIYKTSRYKTLKDLVVLYE